LTPGRSLIKGGSSYEIHRQRGSKTQIWQSGFREHTVRDQADYLRYTEFSMADARPAPRAIPVLETERLRMRPHRPEDFLSSASLWADPVVTRFIGGRPLSGEEVWGRLLRYAGHWNLLGFGYWALEDRRTQAFLGELGFADLQREIEPRLDGMAEIGWVLGQRFHGKGYATEAVRAIIAWGDAHLPTERMVALIDPANMASLRVAEKCGFRELCRTTYQGDATIQLIRDISGR
jgi:RimJ/RimL family protein N-acetyltransferase